MDRVTPPPLPSEDASGRPLGDVGGMLRKFGPAAVLASVSIGAGETIIVVRAGAWMGYGLLWLVLLSVLVKGVCVTYFLGRYTAISGESLGSRLVRFPGPRGWVLLLLAGLELAAAPMLWAAIARPSGELIGYLLYGADAGASTRVVATLFIAVALVSSLPTTYKLLERQQIIICGLLVLGTVVGTMLVRPDFGAALGGFLSFGRIPPVPSSAPLEFRQHALPLLAVTFGYVGGSVMTYLVYPDFIALHRWGMTGHNRVQDIRRRAASGFPADYLPTDPGDAALIKRAASPLRWDIACGAAVLLIVTTSFMIAGAAVLYPRRESGEAVASFSGWHLLTDQSAIWNSIHPSLVWVYYACVIVALWGTLQSYPDIYARGCTEYLNAIWPKYNWQQFPVQLALCGYVLVAATATVWSDVNFDTMTQMVNFLATTLAVAVAMLAGLWLNFQLPPLYRTRRWMLAAGVASASVLLVVTAISGAGVWHQLVPSGAR